MARARRAAVLGRPIGHSLSPALHRAAYRELGLDWTYDAVDVGEEDLAGFLDSLDDSWAGLSLTMPLKTTVLGLLDEVDPLAASVGAVNTVLLGDGHRRGSNTDVPGMVAALRGMGGVREVGEATLLGGGATARSALAALSSLGTGHVTAYTRRPEQGDDLVALGERLGQRVTAELWRRAAEGLLADLVVSTVPAGAADSLAGAVPAGAGTLHDVVYDPWPTALAASWQDHDGVVVDGLELLVQQAALQVVAMTGRQAPILILREAAASARG